MGTSESSTEYEKFIGKTEITNLISQSNILGSGYTYSGLPYVNSSTTLADAYSALTNEMFEDEKVVATALNDLNDRIDEISAATGDNTELLEYLQENEEVVAGALNNLNERVGTVETHMTGDYIPITGYQTATGTTEEELTLTDEDTVNEALGKLQKQMLDNEESIAAGLNDLNTRIENVDDIIAHNTGVTQLSGVVRSFSAATYYEFDDVWGSLSQKANDSEFRNVSGATRALSSATQTLSSATRALSSATISLSGAVMGISAKTSGVLTVNLNGVLQGRYSPSASTTINLTAATEVTGADVLLTGYELATGTTEEELAIVATDTVNEAFGKIQKQNYDNEAVVAGALNDLDERITLLEVSGSSRSDLEELSGSVVDLSGAVVSNRTDINTLSASLIDDELVIAASLNDLNSRTTAISGTVVDLSGAVVSNRTDINTLSASLNDLNSRTTAISGTVDTISGVVETIQANYVTAITSASTNSEYPPAKAVYDEVHPAIITTGGTAATITIEPNVLYNFGALTGTKTFTLATPGDSSVVNHYYWTFDTSTTAPTITWPSGLTWYGGSAPTLSASKHYEISVINGIAISMEV
jgi:ABC-type transporter Mla subunit MlaD